MTRLRPILPALLLCLLTLLPFALPSSALPIIFTPVPSSSPAPHVISPGAPVIALPIVGAPFTNKTGKLYGEHHQTASYEWGATTTPDGLANCGSVSGYAQMFNDDRARGVSFSAEDFGSDNDAYTSSLDNIYAAANQVNALDGWTPGFIGTTNSRGVGKVSVFLCFDFANFPEDSNRITAMIVRFARNPAQMTIKGQVVVSCYAGEGGGYGVVKSIWQPVIAALKAQGINICFLPGFGVTDAAGDNPSQIDLPLCTQFVNGLLKPLGAAGAWRYPYGVPPTSIYSGLPALEAEAQAVHAAGLTWMAPALYKYTGSRSSGLSPPNPRTYYEFCGPEGLDATFQSIINAQHADFVEAATNNDEDEDSASTTAPTGPGSPWNFFQRQETPGFYPSPAGQNALIADYYLPWLETGQKPVITTDRLYEFQHVQMASQVCPLDPRGPATGFLSDANENRGITNQFYIETMLPENGPGAYLGVTQNYPGPHQSYVLRYIHPGITFSRVPCVPGTVYFEIIRGGHYNGAYILWGSKTVHVDGIPIADPNGPNPPTFYNYNVYSASGHS